MRLSDNHGLRGCPFCGSFRLQVKPVGGGVAVLCRDCLASGPPAFNPGSYEGAKANWNRRIIADAVRDRG